MTTKHPQYENLLIAAEDKDALFIRSDNQMSTTHYSIDFVLAEPHRVWTHVKPPYAYQHVKDAWEADNSLVVQSKWRDDSDWSDVVGEPRWCETDIYRIKPKTITKRLYAGKHGFLIFKAEPFNSYTIPINGTETEVEVSDEVLSTAV